MELGGIYRNVGARPDIEMSPAIGIGEVRHPMGPHAPGVGQQAVPVLLHLALGWPTVAVREQVLAGVLGRLDLGATDPELLRDCSGQLSAAGGVRIIRHAVGAHAPNEG